VKSSDVKSFEENSPEVEGATASGPDGATASEEVGATASGPDAVEVDSAGTEGARGVTCRNCGDPVDPRRVELGYDYCLKEECQERCMKRVLLASVAVNKAADYYAKAEELLPPPGPTSLGRVIEPEDGPDDVSPDTVRREGPRPRPVKSTIAKLHELEAMLDVALEASYERFYRGEISAEEMNRERDELITRFNNVVMGQNIRYRGMLRKTRPQRQR
jgi:hypothetical protein